MILKEYWGNHFVCAFFSTVLLVTSNSAPSIITGGNVTTNTVRLFSIDPTTYTFVKDGAPFQYISGSLHYFRIPRYYWLDRLLKAQAAGLDAIETYIAWNFHEPEESTYRFDGDRDVEHFLDLIQQLNMLAILRVGPYICAEWQFGGLPPWLLRKNPRMVLRSSDPDYYVIVTKWLNLLLPKLRRFLYTNGGPIIMIQLENEYGSSAICDHDYMSQLYDLARWHLGPEVILFTTDGNSRHMLQCGSPDQRYLATVDFGPSETSVKDLFVVVDQYRPKQPLINSEFYVGWFDGWGVPHSRSDTKFITRSLQALMKYSPRVNVNMYMFHGGTNFGFWNGNSGDGPVITSYDYDAPISEAGDITDKYLALRDLIHKIKGSIPPSIPKNTTKIAYGTVTMAKTSHVLANLKIHKQLFFPVNMEAVHQYEGFLVYTTVLPANTRSPMQVTLERFADVVHIYTSDENFEHLHWHVTLDGHYNKTMLNMTSLQSHTHLVLLLENTGYVNFGPNMWNDLKGLVGNVTINRILLTPWNISRISGLFDNSGPSRLKASVTDWPIQGSVFFGQLVLESETELYDTFIEPDSFSHGLISINHCVLGRFDQLLGPQLRLFVPKPLLRHGINEITLVEFENLRNQNTTVTFYSEPRWTS